LITPGGLLRHLPVLNDDDKRKERDMAWKIEDDGVEWIKIVADRREAGIRSLIDNEAPKETPEDFGWFRFALAYDTNLAPRTTNRSMLSSIGFDFNDDPVDDGEAEAVVRDCADALLAIGVRTNVEKMLASGFRPMRVHSALSRILDEIVPEIVPCRISRYEELIDITLHEEER
jgi:hypothetical protein